MRLQWNLCFMNFQFYELTIFAISTKKLNFPLLNSKKIGSTVQFLI